MTELSPARPARAQTLSNCMLEHVQTQCIGATPKYRHKVEKAISDFIVYLNQREIAPQLLTGYFPYLIAKGLSQNYVKEIAYFIRRFLHWCWLMGYAQTRWHEYVPKVRGTAQPMPEIILHEEYLKLREATRSPEQDWLVVCGYNTGFRLGDCCMLKWSQIDQKRQVICRVINKTRKTTGARSEIPYVSGGDLHQKLIALQADDTMPDTGQDYVCPVIASEYSLAQGNVRTTVERIFERAGIRGKSFKNLRSTFESRIANSGMNMVLAAKITGRSDLKTLLRYVRPDMDSAREGIAKAMELHHTHKEFA